MQILYTLQSLKSLKLWCNVKILQHADHHVSLNFFMGTGHRIFVLFEEVKVKSQKFQVTVFL